jgi:hypothetical protein
MVDTRIIMGYDPGTEDFNTGYQRGLTLKDAARRSEMQEAEYAQAQQDRVTADNRRQQFGQALGGMVPPELAEFAKADPEGAMKLWEFKKSASKEQRQAFIDSQDMIANVAGNLRAVPQEQRAAAFEQLTPQLLQRGFQPEMLGSVNLTDVGLDGYVSGAVGAVKMMEFGAKERDDKRADAALANKVQQDDIDNGFQAENLGVAKANLRLRGQEVSTNANGISKNDRKAEADLRKEFNGLPDVKAFRDTAGSYRQIRASASKANPTAADDIATVFSYMKMLDPGSVVREGEFANAQNAAGVPDRVRNAYNQAASGNRLNAKQRKEFVESAAGVLVSRGKRYNEIAKEYRGYGGDYGISPDRIAKPVPDITGRRPAPKAAPKANGFSIKRLDQ